MLCMYIYLKVQIDDIRDIKLFIPRENRMCIFFHRFQYTLNGIHNTVNTAQHTLYFYLYIHCMSFTAYIFVYTLMPTSYIHPHMYVHCTMYNVYMYIKTEIQTILVKRIYQNIHRMNIFCFSTICVQEICVEQLIHTTILEKYIK